MNHVDLLVREGYAIRIRGGVDDRLRTSVDQLDHRDSPPSSAVGSADRIPATAFGEWDAIGTSTVAWIWRTYS
jgi:hypothetical protein